MTGPLSDRTVLLTRASGRDAELAALLEARGARVVLAPATRFEPVDADPDPGGFDWLAVTSPTAQDALPARVRNAASTGSVLTAAIGPGTRRALESAGIRVAITSRANSATGLARTLVDAGAGPGTRVLHPTSDRARPEFRETLEDAGVEVVEVVCYRTVAIDGISQAAIGALTAETTSTVVFASPSAIEGFLAALPGELAARVRASARAVAIGPTTGRALHARGFRRVSVSRHPTTEALADCVEAVASQEERP